MKTKLLLLVLCITGGLSNWVIPENLEDGFYHIELAHDHDTNENAAEPIVHRLNETHLQKREGVDGFLGNPSVPPRIDEPPIREVGRGPTIPFDVKKHSCYWNVRRLPRRPYEEARKGFLYFCDNYNVPKGTKHISLSKNGNVIVFMCNLRQDKDGWCYREEYEWVEQNLWEHRCGRLTAAFATARWKKKIYGRGWLGQRICIGISLQTSTWMGSPEDLIHNQGYDPEAEGQQDYDMQNGVAPRAIGSGEEKVMEQK